MAIIKCKMCGGELNLTEGQTVAECEYCGSVQTVPTADNEKKLNLFARANRLRAACEFDKAAVVYESIAAEFPEEAEAYWGLVLCKYGIEYVDDPATGKKVPTCHRSSFDSVMKDGNFELAQEYADVVARRVYREEAKVIEGIRAGILEVSAQEAPYDVFICYKETDFDGNRTLDSVLAQDLYSALTDKGYRVFFARISLEDKLGQQYEPYIFAALNSAKVMLVVGTDYEYFNAVWVKNEWSRFLKLMAQDKGKHLIPCFKGIDAYDMPEEFARLQAQDLGKMGATQDILHGLEKLMPRQTPVKETVVVQTPGVNVDALLKRGQMALEDGLWDKAEGSFDEVLNHDAECARAYLGLAMAEAHTAVVRDFIFKNIQSAHYQRAKQFADPSLLAELTLMENEADSEREEARRRRIPFLAHLRDTIKPSQQMLDTCDNCCITLSSDGTAFICMRKPNGLWTTQHWTGIVSVSTGPYHSIGLKADGSVLAYGVPYGVHNVEACDVKNWEGIFSISAGVFHSLGLKTDGTVVACGYNHHNQCNIDHWTDIVAVSAGGRHTLGLKPDGSVVAIGDNASHQCDVSFWTDIVAISAGTLNTLGLRADGTVAACGDNAFGQNNVQDWTDIIAISSGHYLSLGLTSDGRVLASGNNQNGQCNVQHWTDVVAICAGTTYSLGLKADGSIIYSGTPHKKTLDYIQGKKLFHSFKKLNEEIQHLHMDRQFLITDTNRRAVGLCRHCGGAFKGLFSKTCSACGKVKDY